MESIRKQEDPYQLFEDYLKNSDTRRKYRNFLFRFLRSIPQEILRHLSNLDKGSQISDKKLVEIFVDLARNDPIVAKNVIAAYIKEKNKLAEEGKINPNYVPNLIKPIHTLLDANGIPFHWKSLYKLFPRGKKTSDRAYTKEEIQKMLDVSTNITDKVIILLFSSAGFRLESWNYFIWDDVRFFKNSDDSFRGGAIRIYREDPEEYWSCFTPEAAKILQLYREYWKSKTGDYPTNEDPLLRSDRSPVTKRLNAFGVKRRLEKIVKRIGLRHNHHNGSNRYEVALDHGFRKYFNTMLRRAKVDYLDKEDMMGHKVGLEKHYERYNEEDFERFPEYQKAIPFLTISDKEMLLLKNQQLTEERSELEKRIPQTVRVLLDLNFNPKNSRILL